MEMPDLEYKQPEEQVLTVDDHPVFPWLTRPRRAYFYRLVTAAAPLAVVYGMANEQSTVVWIGVAAAVLGTGTATLHTPTGS